MKLGQRDTALITPKNINPQNRHGLSGKQCPGGPGGPRGPRRARLTSQHEALCNRFHSTAARTQYPSLFCVAVRYNIVK
jgi:hypothetical protein